MNLVLRAAVRPRRPGVVDRPRRADQRRLAASSACGARGWYQPAPGWGRFALAVVFATLALGALLGWAARAHRLGRPAPARDGSASAWLAACLGGGGGAVFRRAARQRPAAARLHAARLSFGQRAAARAKRRLRLELLPRAAAFAVRDADGARIFRRARRRRREPVAARSGRRPSRRTTIRRSTRRPCWPRSTRWRPGSSAACRPMPCRCSGCAG